MRNYPTNADDVIDSRNVITRIDKLESEKTALEETVTDAEMALQEADEEGDPDGYTDAKDTVVNAKADLEGWDHADEFKALQDLAEEACGYSSDWPYGAILIRDSYFVEYTQELLTDIGDLPRNLPAYIEIDWEKTAENIQVDYTSVGFDGVVYWIR